MLCALPGEVICQLREQRQGAEQGGRRRAKFAWQLTDGAVALLAGSQVVWRFRFDEDARKPHFHPLALPGGPTLTVDRPPDHPWHHGLWFSWKEINGVEYWAEDRKSGLSPGRTHWSKPRIETDSDFAARILLDLTYGPPNRPPVLKERRILTITPPRADGSYAIDWCATFTALAPQVLLERTPPPGEPGGVPWGGYAGLSLRFAPEFRQPEAVDIDGPVRFEGAWYRGRSPAMDYSGLIAGTYAGVAILDHVHNPRAPTPWHMARTKHMCGFGPAVIAAQPMRLAQDDSFTLRYRIIVHFGRWSASQLRAELRRFCGKVH
jgi:hypothetical protein